ncbi:MAG: hypothetical protein C0404_10580 [Verrucomicrobia bacterium]|nr:hypothetical protein [Verrucomicrobiota bacterium]
MKAMLFVLAVCIAMSPQVSAQDKTTGVQGVSIFDTGASSPTRLAPEALLKRTGWATIPENSLTHNFKGDTVLMNNRFAVTLRQGAAAVEVYSLSAKGLVLRASATPVTESGTGRIAGLRIDQNDPDIVRVIATLATAKDQKVSVTFETKVGQPYVRTDIGDEKGRLMVEAPCRFAVMPDFKGKDNKLFDAGKLAEAKTDLPNWNFVLNMLGKGDAILTVARDIRQPGLQLVAEGEKESRAIAAIDMPYGKKGQIWLAVLEGPDAWFEVKANGEKPKTPFEADWRTMAGDPGVMYPHDRAKTTPLTTFTAVDIIRNALGPGPCHYILDLDEVLVNIGMKEARKATGLSMTKDEIKAWLEKETPEQKKLREELAELAKKGEKIYYNSSYEGIQKVYCIAPDGSDQKCWTPQSWTNNQEYPHVSRDGKRILYVTHKSFSKAECMKLASDPDFTIAKGDRWGFSPIVYIANIDGSDAKPVAIGSCPHWSWDDKYLAYGVQPKPNQRKYGLLDIANNREWIFNAPGGNTPTFSRDMKYFITGAFYIHSVKMEDIVSITTNHNVKSYANSYGCNNEISWDGTTMIHVIDEKDGSWIFHYPYDPMKSVGIKGKPVELGVARNSMNYFPEFAPDMKYVAWGHWDTWEGRGQPKANVYNTTAADLYVCRWPANGVSVRITWHGGTTQNPSWTAAGPKQ